MWQLEKQKQHVYILMKRCNIKAKFVYKRILPKNRRKYKYIKKRGKLKQRETRESLFIIKKNLFQHTIQKCYKSMLRNEEFIS